MDQLFAALDGAWRVLAAGLVLGAGLPSLFAFAVKQLAASRVPDSAGVRWHSTVHRIIAYVTFTFVVLAVLLGLSYIIAHGFGYTIGFSDGLPVIAKK